MQSLKFGKEIFKDGSFPFNISMGYVEGEFPMHSHDFSELLIVLKGRGEHIINNESYELRTGDVFIIKGSAKHGFKKSHGLEVCNIMFDPNNFLFQTNELRKMRGFQCLFVLEPYYRELKQFKSRMKLSLDNLKHVHRIIQELSNEFLNQQQAYKTRITALFAELVVFLSREYEVEEIIDSRVLIQISEAITFMELNYLEQIKLEDIAEKAFVSPSHFCRIFKSTYKVSPIDYVIKLRIWHAGQLLRFKDKTVTQIAFESGFQDSNYFARRFKKEMGMSPKEYRNHVH